MSRSARRVRGWDTLAPAHTDRNVRATGWLGHSCPSTHASEARTGMSVLQGGWDTPVPARTLQRHGQECPCDRVAGTVLSQRTRFLKHGQECPCYSGWDILVPAHTDRNVRATVAGTLLSQHARSKHGQECLLQGGWDILVPAHTLLRHGQECPCYRVAGTLLSQHTRF